ncbi:hypothetical protein UFOVP178_7 [uncultured Caudovirales phage]|uniref:Uncharacterized protein n=1 Tax=uncultured Caudovirales phage TaxID=2100421 RepID=A0A6J7WAU3_9CAUD|nr:hypothetical protein UFOVP178_7 [uncultured Caudovirales phage]
MIFNQAFVPGKRYPNSRVVVGNVTIDAAEFQSNETVHSDRTFTTGYGGATKVDVKGYTITGRIQAYVAKSGVSPETSFTNLPARGSITRIKLWSGGHYAEGDALILERQIVSSGGKFTVVDISFESDGMWDVVTSVVELV